MSETCQKISLWSPRGAFPVTSTSNQALINVQQNINSDKFSFFSFRKNFLLMLWIRTEVALKPQEQLLTCRSQMKNLSFIPMNPCIFGLPLVVLDFTFSLEKASYWLHRRVVMDTSLKYGICSSSDFTTGHYFHSDFSWWAFYCSSPHSSFIDALCFKGQIKGTIP